jgi:hypothetical protein
MGALLFHLSHLSLREIATTIITTASYLIVCFFQTLLQSFIKRRIYFQSINKMSSALCLPSSSKEKEVLIDQLKFSSIIAQRLLDDTERLGNLLHFQHLIPQIIQLNLTAEDRYSLLHYREKLQNIN